MPDSNNDDWVRTGQSKRTTRGIHPPGAFSVWRVVSIAILLLLGAIPTAVAVEPTTGVLLEEDTLPTAAPVIVEYWKDNRNDPSAAEDANTQQPSPAPILWDYWPSTTYTTSAPSETTTTAISSSTSSSNTNAKDSDQTEEDNEDEDEDDSWLLYVILGAAGVGLIVVLGGCAYCYRYHKCCNNNNNNHRASSSTTKKAEEATDRSTADETEGGGAENDGDTQSSRPAGWTVSETSPEDLEQPPPLSPREECPNKHTSSSRSTDIGLSTSTWIPSPIAQPSSPSPQHAQKQPQQRQSTTQHQQQQQQQQQQRTELRVPTLQCRKLLTVASVKAALVQQEPKHGPIILLSDDDDDEESGDSLAVRELKQANAVLAGHHTEL